MSSKLIVIAHNIRSSHNVGSLIRTCEGLGIQELYLTGYTPYPAAANDERLPHLAHKIDSQIQKTALGAEQSLVWHHSEDIESVIIKLRNGGVTIAALEQAPASLPLPSFVAPKALALILGSEVGGLEQAIIDIADEVLEIPMLGKKESFNVVVAAGMALYHCRFPR